MHLRCGTEWIISQFIDQFRDFGLDRP